MPVLGQHYGFEALDQLINRRDDGITVRDRQRAAGAEIVLHVDDDDEGRLGPNVFGMVWRSGSGRCGPVAPSVKAHWPEINASDMPVRIGLLAFCPMAWSEPAVAHGTERGLPLPTGYYLFGGGAAGATSFLLLWSVRRVGLNGCLRRGCASGRCVTSACPDQHASVVLLLVLLAAGFFGSHDPLLGRRWPSSPGSPG
jgi:hypothetical protein